MNKKLLLIAIVAFFATTSTAQKIKKPIRCFTTQAVKMAKENNANSTTDQEFEAWLSPLIKQKKQKSSSLNRLAIVNYTLPIVFHIIHNGESVGIGNNVAASTLQAQVLQLNKDYANLSGSSYSAATNAGIQFAMATRDPNGNTLLEAGIDRINLNTLSFTSLPYSINYIIQTVKPATIWDPNKYLNVWLIDMTGDLILGFATFPSGSTLSGLSNGETNTTAGVVVDPTTVGSIFSSANCGSNSTYTLGKTLTHEMGHFFGLRHIWGDQIPSPCSDDFCADTPLHFDANYGKPQHPKPNSCGTADEMFENYMDYCDDNVLNTFTADQVDRMQTVLLNSTRRVSLATSTIGLTSIPTSNKIAFANCSGALKVFETGNTGTTNRYKDVSIALNVENIATGNATVTLVTSGSAINTVHYQLASNTLSFSANDAGKVFILRILDNAINDGDKTLTFTYTISGTGVVAGTTAQSLTITIVDNDDVIVGQNAATLINQNFDNSSPSWSTLSSGGSNVFTVSQNGDAGGSGNCAHITNNTFSRTNTYDPDEENIAILRSPLVNAVGYKNLQLSYKYKVYGEADGSDFYDFGMLVYSLSSAPNAFTTAKNLDAHLVGSTGIIGGSKTISNSINGLAGTQFYLGFLWSNDDNTGNNPGINVDDVVLTADVTKVETTVSNSYTFNISNTASTNHVFKSVANDNIIAIIKNANGNVNNVVASIAEAGTDRLNILSGANTYLRSRKVIKVVPTIANTTTQHSITLFYTTAEVSTWSNASVLKVLKVNDGTSLSSNLNSTTSMLLNAVVDDKRTTDGYISYTITPIGFGSFVLVDAATILPVSWLNFNGTIEHNTIKLNWATAIEIDNKGFEVQRSTNGIIFTNLGFVSSKNGTNSQYTFVDATAAANQQYYYRLLQKDNNGNSSFSNTISMQLSNNNAAYKLLPNPFSNKLTIQNIPINSRVDIQVNNALGQKIYQQIATANAIIINTESWLSGTYWVTIITNGVSNSFNVVKQ